MESYSVGINPNQIPNLIFKHDAKHRMNLSVLITAPARELKYLKALDALDGIENNISEADLKKTPDDKAWNLIKKLEGRALYWNDKCPMMGKNTLNFDLTNTLQFLESAKKNQPGTFATSKILLSENFIGSNTKKGHPPHHALNEVTQIFPENFSYPPEDIQLPSPPTDKKEEGDETINLNVEEDLDPLCDPRKADCPRPAELLLTKEITNPVRELKLLEEIAALDGDAEMVSKKDLEIAKKRNLLEQLEGYGLYTNDKSEKSTIYDLNMASGILTNNRTQYDLSKMRVIFEEKLITEDQRHIIRKAHFLLNEKSGHFIKINILDPKLD